MGDESNNDPARAAALEEPQRLRAWASAGALLVVLMTVLSIALAVHRGTWASGPPADLEGPCKRSQTQIDDWKKQTNAAQEDLRTSEKRLDALRSALGDPKVSAFADARARLDEEQAVHDRLGRRIDKLAFQPLDAELLVRIVLLLFDVLVSVGSARLLLRTATFACARDRDEVFQGWERAYAALVVAGVAVAVGTMLQTAFVEKTKVWLAWDSFAVSPAAWLTNVGLFAGVAMMFSWPYAILWSLSSSELLPAKVDPRHPDGSCGVGDYVDFLLLWTTLVFLLPMLIVIAWLRYMEAAEATFDRSYLLPVFGGAVVAALFGGKLLRNGILLRRKYLAARAALGNTWKEVDDENPAPDPTSVFLGENWWKLPATYGAMFAALWAILKWTNVGDLITSVFR